MTNTLGMNYLASLSRFVPEVLASITMLGLLVIEASFSNRSKQIKARVVYGFATTGLVVTILALVENLQLPTSQIFYGSISIDTFSSSMKLIATISTLGVIYLSSFSKEIYSFLKTEFVVMAIGVLIGCMLLASANNFLTLYLGVETLSILSYVLASFKKVDERSNEAGLKYVLYGGFTAGIMLFGISHIFGVVGSIGYAEVAAKLGLMGNMDKLILIPSFILFFAGLGYKISCVPFHMWTPDVYEGSPTPVTAFFSLVPKFGGLVALMKISILIGVGQNVVSITWIGLLSLVAALTMSVGNISALGQKSVKRMLAYSSIAHAGNMILAIVVLKDGLNALVFYAITYTLMTLVAFYIVSIIHDKYGSDHFDRFNGLITRNPAMAIAFTIILFSLAGLPPFGGFIAKFNIISIIVKKSYYTLAVIAVLNSVISLYYYLRLVRLMIFKQSEDISEISGFNFSRQTVVAMMTLTVVILGLFWNNLFDYLSRTVASY